MPWVKVDTQGNEGNVLTGATRYLANADTVWLLEVWPYGLECAGWTVEQLCLLCKDAHLAAFDLGPQDRPVEFTWPKLLAKAQGCERYSGLNVGLAHKGGKAWLTKFS